MNPQNFRSWMRAQQWCRNMQPSLDAHGPMLSKSRDSNIDKLFPVLSPVKGVCHVAHTGPGQSTPQIITPETVRELEKWEKGTP